VLAWRLWKRSPEVREALGFALGASLVGGSVLALTIVRGGLEPWREFQAKIVEHDERPASDTVGFRKLFLWTIDFRADQGREIRALFERRKALWWAWQASFGAFLAWLLRRRPLHEALCLSFPLVWSFASPAYYYYAFLVVPLLWFAERLARPARALGLALVFATSLLARAFHAGPTFGGYFAFKLSFVMGVLAAYVTLAAVREARRAMVVVRAGAGETGASS
jgi:hypothetical protein